VTVEVPRIDESVQEFFGSVANKGGDIEKVEVSIDVFDDLFIFSNDM
jgi:hypothetical protein